MSAGPGQTGKKGMGDMGLIWGSRAGGMHAAKAGQISVDSGGGGGQLIAAQGFLSRHLSRVHAGFLEAQVPNGHVSICLQRTREMGMVLLHYCPDPQRRCGSCHRVQQVSSSGSHTEGTPILCSASSTQSQLSCSWAFSCQEPSPLLIYQPAPA